MTGGAGFIGANLVRLLVERGHRVRVIDDLSTGQADNLVGVECELITETILNPASLDGCFTGAQSVVHLAALGSVPRSVADPLASNDANVNGTLQVLEAARRSGVDHVVVASSSSVYGRNPTLPKHEALVPHPMSPYAVSKLATEAYALAYQEVYGMGALAFRFFNVFGPLQPAGHAYAAVVPAFIDAAVRNETLSVHGDGQQTRDFTYVGSVVNVLCDAVERRVVNESPVNLAFGGRSSLLEVIALLEELLGRELSVVHAAPRAGDVRDSQADSRLLDELFPGVEPVSLRDGLALTVEWFLSRG